MKSNRSNQKKQSRGTGMMSGGISLLAGAAIGTAVMYFFDPQIGRSRRRQIGNAAHGALDQGKAAMGAALSAAATQAGHAADRLRDRLRRAADSAASMASDQAQHLADQAGDARDQAAEFASRQLRRVGNALPHDREHHFVGQTACALGSLALGAGAVYFFDPNHGARRRGQAQQQFVRAIRSTGGFFGALGRHLREMFQAKHEGVQSAVESYHASNELTQMEPSHEKPFAANPAGS